MLAHMAKLSVDSFARLEGESVRSAHKYCSSNYDIFSFEFSDGPIQADPGLYQSYRQHNTQFYATCSCATWRLLFMDRVLVWNLAKFQVLEHRHVVGTLTCPDFGEEPVRQAEI